MIQPVYTDKKFMLFCHSKHSSSSKVIMPVIGFIPSLDMFVTKAVNYAGQKYDEYYIERTAEELRKRDVHVGYRERGISPAERFQLMVECDPKEATDVNFRRGKLALAHAESTWMRIIKWNDRGELYVNESILPLGVNPFFSFDVYAHRLEIPEAKYGASLIDVRNCNATYYKPVAYDLTEVEKLFTE